VKSAPWLIFLVVLAGGLSADQAALRIQARTGAAVEITCRSFQPGEAVLAVLHKTADVQAAKITFLGKSSGFAAMGPKGLPFALLAISLDTRPGSYRVRAEFLGRSGKKEIVERYVRVQDRSFLRRDIFLEDESRVTPPPEAEERIAHEQQLLARVYQSTGPEWLGSGNFKLPLDGQPIPNFGEIRILNKVRRSRHTGVDMDAEMGVEVSASNSGRVALAMDLYFSGNTVVLDHGLGVFSVYCHFSRLAVQEGQVVRRGDVIGYVGSTGRATGPHLHWAVRLQETRVDPLSVLSLVLE